MEKQDLYVSIVELWVCAWLFSFLTVSFPPYSIIHARFPEPLIFLTLPTSLESQPVGLLHCLLGGSYSSFNIQLTSDFSGVFPEFCKQVLIGKLFLPHLCIPLTVPPKYFVCEYLSDSTYSTVILLQLCDCLPLCTKRSENGGQALFIYVLINCCWIWRWVQLFALFTLSVMCSHSFIHQALIKCLVL